MATEVVVPTLGESITEATLGEWLKQPGDAVAVDEPIASLDLCHQLALLDMARSIAGRGVAVLIVLHDLNLAVTYADHLVVMDRGRIIAQGPPAETLDDALLQQVFRVGLSLSRAPAPGLPFLLPQQHRRAPSA